MRVHCNRVVAVTALAGIVSLAAVSPAVAAPRPDNVILKGAGGGTCVEFDDDGVPEWFEDSTPELDRLASDLQDIAYYSDRNGGVIAAGIVTATNTTTSYCTQLNGVRAWNSNTQLG